MLQPDRLSTLIPAVHTKISTHPDLMRASVYGILFETTDWDRYPVHCINHTRNLLL